MQALNLIHLRRKLDISQSILCRSDAGTSTRLSIAPLLFQESQILKKDFICQSYRGFKFLSSLLTVCRKPDARLSAYLTEERKLVQLN